MVPHDSCGISFTGLHEGHPNPGHPYLYDITVTPHASRNVNALIKQRISLCTDLITSRDTHISLTLVDLVYRR